MFGTYPSELFKYAAMIELLISLAMVVALGWLAWRGFSAGLAPVGAALLAVAGLCAWLAAMKLRVMRWNHRFANGLCPYCGYDLRATHNECPECGAKPPNGTTRDLRKWLEISAEDRMKRKADKF